MGKKDTKAKEYMSDNARFADLCNLALFDGRKVVSAASLQERDTTEVLSIVSADSENPDYQQKWRDLLKSVVIKAAPNAVFALIGVENQSNIHYAMPIKSMVYDALNYASQVKAAERKHKADRDFVTSDEFLSGFTKADKLIPIIPITFYLGKAEWDAPVSLHEMFGNIDDCLMPYVSDYKINLVSPKRIDREKLDSMETDLRNLMLALKYSEDHEEFSKLFQDNPQFKSVPNETVDAINLFVGTDFPKNKEGETTDMCKAYKEIRDEAISQGIEEGIEKERFSTIKRMLKRGKSPEEISDFCGYPIEEIMIVQDEILQSV